MSLFSFTKKNKESYSLIFNIGSGSVSGGIAKFTEKVGVQMTNYFKEVIPLQKEVSAPKYLDLMKSTLTTVANRIQSEGLKKINSKNSSSLIPDRIFYIFSSPWSVSQTKTIRIKESKAFKVTENYLNRVVEEQEKHFKTEISKVGRIIERKIVQLKINGYVVNNVYGKFTKNLEISIFFTVVPEEILQVVEEAVSKIFNVKDVWCHSLSLALLSNIRNLFPQKEDFIHIDISEEMTDISIIKDNIMISEASIPFGRNHFTRELSRNLKVTDEVADSMIKMHCLKNNDELGTLKLAVAMEAVSMNWLTKISEVLDSFRERIYVPETIFFIANTDLSTCLKEKLEKRDFKVSLVDNKKIKPMIVGENIIFRLGLMFLDNLYKI